MIIVHSVLRLADPIHQSAWGFLFFRQVSVAPKRSTERDRVSKAGGGHRTSWLADRPGFAQGVCVRGSSHRQYSTFFSSFGGIGGFWELEPGLSARQ